MTEGCKLRELKEVESESKARNKINGMIHVPPPVVTGHGHHDDWRDCSRPVVIAVRARLCTLAHIGAARLRTLAPDSFARLRTVALLVLVVFLFKGTVCCTNKHHHRTRLAPKGLSGQKCFLTRLRTVTHGCAHRGRTATHAWTSLDRTAVTTGLDCSYQQRRRSTNISEYVTA